MKKILALVVLIALCSYDYIRTDTPGQNPFLITDYSRLHPVKVERVVPGKEKQQLIDLVQDASKKHLTISIAGQRHSQGGHTYYKDGIVVDMSQYNKILSIDPAAKTITVQAGATWRQIQDAINPYGLAVQSMQSQNIFSVGGSISVNAHGRDVRYGSLIGSVKSFHLLTADGRVLEVSRSEHPELFTLALGGYGLFGIILDVTLKLVDNEMYRLQIDSTTVKEYSQYFQRRVLDNPNVHMHIARISVAPNHFLTSMYAMNYIADQQMPLKNKARLKTRESLVIPTKFFFGLNRDFDWGKNMFWKLQLYDYLHKNGHVISRNNAMRPDSAFLEYTEPGSNDLLQEYFIPTGEFAGFVQDMKQIVKSRDMNLMNITVRYVKQDREAELSYANQNMFALVCLFHTSLSNTAQEQFKLSIQKIIDAVIQHHGTYYLPYANYPSLKQFHETYPNYETFAEKKNDDDPQHLFMNYFYKQYIEGASQ